VRPRAREKNIYLTSQIFLTSDVYVCVRARERATERGSERERWRERKRGRECPCALERGSGDAGLHIYIVYWLAQGRVRD
jgi:hypothetical protein